jgi:hypothetical protein
MLGSTNDIDYDKHKTPFRRITITNADKSKVYELPPHLLGLVEKVEIIESKAGCNITSLFHLTFKEGSREPFDKSLNTKTAALYSKTGDITNATGMLTDLRFSSGGFSSLIPSAVGLVASALPSALSGLTGTSSAAPEKKTVVGDDEAKATGINYVFQERNKVQVTWGYLEDQKNQRTVRGDIIMIQSDFPDAGHPQVVVTCSGPGSWLDQIAPVTATYFRDTVTTAFSNSGKPIQTFTDLSTSDLIKKLLPGFELYVSDNLLSTKLSKNGTKLIRAGQSPDRFLRELAKTNNAMYITYYSPKTGKPSAAFISRTDFLSTPVINNASLTTYKAPGSLIKSISVKADFNSLSGSGNGGVDNSGQTQITTAGNSTNSEVLFGSSSLVDTSPISKANGIAEAKKINDSVFNNDGSNVSKFEMNPNANDTSYLIGKSKSKAACMGRTIFLEFSALGYTRFTVGAINFGGIGNRYSGVYEVLTVTHTIDASGYNCRGSAESASISGSTGVKPKGAVELPAPAPVSVPLFKSASLKQALPEAVGSFLTASTTGSTAMDDYLEDILT